MSHVRIDDAIDGHIIDMTPVGVRWLAPSPSALAVQPGCARLQQAFRNITTGEIEWHDVPVVFESGERE